jgi:formylglycine-generating enzyme required for sulfatase activity
VPWEHSALTGRFYFNVTTNPIAAAPQSSAASSEWSRVDKSSIAELETFVRRHGSSVEAEYARARLADLEKRQVVVATPPSAPKHEPCDGIEVSMGASERRCLKPGAGKTDWFKDCPTCPEMVVVPAGRFTAGSPTVEPEREPFFKGSEEQFPVTMSKPFAASRFAVTRGEFTSFVAATGHRAEGGCYVHTGSEWKLQSDRNWRSPGFSQTDRHPVVCVNWNDAKAFAAWLFSTTGKTYRLLSETEREYAARAGTMTSFWLGSSISPQQANYSAEPYKAGDEWRKATVAVDAFAANPWGLYNVHGNVWDWVEDCWNEKNAGNPGDGSARMKGECGFRVMRGGSWFNGPRGLRSANRFGKLPDDRNNNIGFRVGRTLEASELGGARIDDPKKQQVAGVALSVPITECDRLAAAPSDPDAVAPRIALDRVDHVRAVPACEEAAAKYPEVLRFVFQLATAYCAANRHADCLHWVRVSVEKGYAPAFTLLGFLYDRGQGVAKDDYEALRWYRADAGNARGMYRLGTMYENGRGITKDDAEAVRWYRNSAEAGDALAMQSLAVMYENGRGVGKNEAEAASWYRKAAAAGYGR